MSIADKLEILLSKAKADAELKQRLLDTRKLDHDTSTPSLNLLDVWLNNTETVDTCTKHVERVVNSLIYCSTENRNHLCIS